MVGVGGCSAFVESLGSPAACDWQISPPPPIKVITSITASTPLILVPNMAFTTPSVRATTLAETTPAACPAASRLAALIVDATRAGGADADADPADNATPTEPEKTIPRRASRFASNP